MSMLSKNLEKSLHRAFGLAGERRHEYATLEHLLLAMTEDDDAVPVASRASSPRTRASRCRPRASNGSSSAPPSTSSLRAARK